MCCSKKPVQGWLKTLLIVWLILTSFRQAFDLIGHLWIPVLVNLIQILLCISGIFAVYQKRVALLVTFAVACFLSILYNIALILWYNDVFDDHNRPLLTMGLPHGYSFFVQHTPFCDSFFNVTSARWAQKNGCLFGYTIIESGQAVFHLILALLTAVFSLIVARQRHNECLKRSSVYDSRTQLTKMHIENAPMPKPNNCRAPNSNSSTSYLNSSYESPEIVAADPQLLKKILVNANTKFPKPKPIEGDNFSSAPTIEMNSTKSNTTTDSPPSSQVEAPKNQRLTRTLPERRSCGPQLAKILDQSADSACRYSKLGNAVSINQSRRKSEHLRSTASANNATMLKETEDNSEYIKARRRVAARLANLNGEPPIRASSYHKRQGSSGNLTSLISFDPKSSTFIRVQEHQNDTDEEENVEVKEEEQPAPICRTNSPDSAPDFPAPTLTKAPEQSSDHSHHSINSKDSPNWSQGGISFPPQQFNPNCVTRRLPRDSYNQGRRFAESREIPLRFSNDGVVSPESITYEQIGGRFISTAFPVTHSRQRSYCGISLSTAMPLIKQEQPPEEEYSSYKIHKNQREIQHSPIVSTHFSRAFHDRWLSGNHSHDDLPPPPPTSLLNTANFPHSPASDQVEGLLV